MSFEPAVRPALQPSALAWHMVFVGSQLLVPEDDGQTLAPLALAEFEAAALARHYLGRLDGLDCWALRLEAAPSGWRPVPLRAAMMGFAAPLSALAGRAAQVMEWDRTHRYCGVCATPTELSQHERARRCPSCNHTAYPRLSPSMMALVWREGELLLARGPHFVNGMYSALAGFVEAGESLEECVRREVHEEVGVQVADLRYFGSQSWPFPHSLMVAYTARWTGGEIVAQPDEIEHAAWFGVECLPNIPPRFSISGHLIRDTVKALSEGLLP
jgi:NAD+ diphosphatase